MDYYVYKAKYYYPDSEEYWDATECRDCISPAMNAGTLQVIDAANKLDALMQASVPTPEIMERFLADIDFNGYRNAREDWRL